MRYTPNYSADKLEELRRYVEDFIAKLEGAEEKLAASAITEEYRRIISRAPSDGDARYIFFNNLLFKGRLPKNVKVYIMDAKTDKSRSTGFDTDARRKNYKSMMDDAKDPKDQTIAAWYKSSRSIYLFADRIGKSDFQIDTALVHEMCHVYQDLVCKPKPNSRKDKRIHGREFQIAKRRVERASKNIYNGGAYIDIDTKGDEYERGRYGDPSVGRTDKQVSIFYRGKINSEIKKLQKGLKLVNLADKEFEFKGNKFIFAKKRFTFRVVPYNSQSIKTDMRELNTNYELLEFLTDAFDRVAKGKGI